MKKKYYLVDLEKLEETDKINNTTDYKGEDDNFLKKIKKYPSKSVIALLGNYGTGKSVFLKKVQEISKKENSVKWVHFDAWKFPNRQDLWEGFILEYAKNIDNELFNSALNRVDGNPEDNKSDRLLQLAECAEVPFINFSKIRNLGVKSAKRVFQLQKIFKGLIKKDTEEKNIFIVIEDIDRCDDFGLFFLETLQNFLGNNSFEEKKIKIITPMSPNSLADKFERYLKCIDFCEKFNFSQINIAENIFEEVSILEEDKDKKLFKKLISGVAKNKDIRYLKFLLRQTEKAIQNLYKINNGKYEIFWNIVLFLEAAKYDWISEKTTYFKQKNLLYSIPENNSSGSNMMGVLLVDIRLVLSINERIRMAAREIAVDRDFEFEDGEKIRYIINKISFGEIEEDSFRINVKEFSNNPDIIRFSITLSNLYSNNW